MTCLDPDICHAQKRISMDRETAARLIWTLVLGGFPGAISNVSMADSMARQTRAKRLSSIDAGAHGPKEPFTGMFVRRFFTAYVVAPPARWDFLRRFPASPYSSPSIPFGEHLGSVVGTPDTVPDSHLLARALQGTQVGKTLRASPARILSEQKTFKWALTPERKRSDKNMT